jgi:hypothetical protein
MFDNPGCSFLPTEVWKVKKHKICLPQQNVCIGKRSIIQRKVDFEESLVQFFHDYTLRDSNISEVETVRTPKIYLDTSVISHLNADDAPEKMNDTLLLLEELKQESIM